MLVDANSILSILLHPAFVNRIENVSFFSFHCSYILQKLSGKGTDGLPNLIPLCFCYGNTLSLSLSDADAFVFCNIT